ncbi:conserved hypothetical protein [Delftia acidovorans SPH-1]|uniref:Uncharacterized protein n=4 Tax=Burkholderiales TaxID=80840 RepID=A9BTQ2_DELAS|nr:hypothetical protein Rmet_2997 [Cupriavidus metallidurans CH34]ABX35316.1 conserved hypothetical protein [Delftia acidovorans SPH-1]KKL40469.1 hypothetical protein WR31_21895 [Burkholderia contaminans LMG 23361]MBA0443539.1 hypothetical protein [Stenotrophomonas maltophilia]OMI78451.1 hypothetical protein BED46_044630 [Burkholderia contaminans]OVZ61741.1 hypothetical protein CDO44_05610 [Pigmentiphaga sp. NML080357]PZQ73087.1 MAG: hypothetical protein DI563_16035 [Variovorax paradoxus]PZU
MTPLDPLLLFVVANTVGPSTSSLYSLYLGATYGVRGALGYTLGTSLGFSIVVTTSSVLVAVAYEIPAGGQFGLKLFASGYTAWIASKCLRTAWTSSRDSTKALAFTKLGAYDGAIQQLANPRGWALATVSVVGFSDAQVPPLMEGSSQKTENKAR